MASGSLKGVRAQACGLCQSCCAQAQASGTEHTNPDKDACCSVCSRPSRRGGGGGGGRSRRWAQSPVGLKLAINVPPTITDTLTQAADCNGATANGRDVAIPASGIAATPGAGSSQQWQPPGSMRLVQKPHARLQRYKLHRCSCCLPKLPCDRSRGTHRCCITRCVS